MASRDGARHSLMSTSALTEPDGRSPEQPSTNHRRLVLRDREESLPNFVAKRNLRVEKRCAGGHIEPEARLNTEI